jgi:hypothetical protein
VHEYTAGVVQSCVIDPASTSVQALALDAYGRVGLIESEPISQVSHGALYSTATGKCGTKVTGSEFGPLVGHPTSLAFETSKPSEPLADRMYVPEEGFTGPPQEIEAYVPVVFPEAKTCAAEEVMATSAKLCGEIDPNALPTRGFFRYGTEKGKLTEETPTAFKGQNEVFLPVHWQLAGLVPNQEYWYAMVAETEVEGKKETTAGTEVPFHTTTPPPEVPGEPSASFVGNQSAVLSAPLNPEHATTHYHFEYGPCEKLENCAGINTTEDQESSRYGLIGTAQEARSLIPKTTYSFRLVANNKFENKGKPEGGETKGEKEGRFTTAASPVPQAMTGAPNAVGTTTATISGSVNPDGQPATYAFLLGLYNGANTQYGVVTSASAGAGTVPIEETLPLTGLQPGTTYAYQIKIQSGYGEATGAPATFTTTGLPAAIPVPTVLEQLPTPPIAFPKQPKITPKKHTPAQELARALKACNKQPKNKQTTCKHNAHKKHTQSQSKKARKK